VETISVPSKHSWEDVCHPPGVVLEVATSRLDRVLVLLVDHIRRRLPTACVELTISTSHLDRVLVRR